MMNAGLRRLFVACVLGSMIGQAARADVFITVTRRDVYVTTSPVDYADVSYSFTDASGFHSGTLKTSTAGQVSLPCDNASVVALRAYHAAYGSATTTVAATPGSGYARFVTLALVPYVDPRLVQHVLRCFVMTKATKTRAARPLEGVRIEVKGKSRYPSVGKTDASGEWDITCQREKGLVVTATHRRWEAAPITFDMPLKDFKLNITMKPKN